VVIGPQTGGVALCALAGYLHWCLPLLGRDAA
jgi:hypothetical protein